MKTIIYTVDDEEPDCNRCDHCCGEDYYCIKQCGAEHGWKSFAIVATKKSCEL